MSTWKQKTIWQLLKDDSSLTTGWCKVGDFWYYMDSAGTMYQSQWYQDTNNSKWYYLDENGHMMTGWQKIDNKNYCFASDGSLYTNCTTPDGYIVDVNGVWSDDSSLVSNELIDFIKSFEGFSSTPYFDEVNVKTLGYGMTGEEIDGIESVTEEQATQMLKDWINKKYAPVIKSDLESKGITLNKNEFDALVSFAYNCGTGALLNQSTLYKNVVVGVRDVNTITSNFQAWSNAGGKRLEGLYKRRTQEANIFLNGVYDSTH